MPEIKLQMNRNRQIMSSLGIGKGERLQRFVDHEIAKGLDKYVPFREGTLKNSVNRSVFGSGKLVYDTPYARFQYYKGRLVSGVARGRLWAERYKQNEMKSLERKAQMYMKGL